MAKVTAPLLSFGAKGQVANSLVYSTWKGRPYSRRYVVPSNPRTTSQMQTRNLFSWLSDLWKNSPAPFRAPWTEYANGQVLTNRNAVIGQNIQVMKGETDISKLIFSPGAKGGVGAESVTPTPSDVSISLAVAYPTPPTGWTFVNAFGAAIKQQDPLTEEEFAMSIQDDDMETGTINITGLTASTEYVVGVWIQWQKPDGTTAYGPSVVADVTTTA